MLHESLSFKIIGCCFRVHNELGAGLLEQCYHNALFYELRACGFKVGYNAKFNVRYRGQLVGEYFADLLVEDKIILELKAVKRLNKVHYAQIMNYLHISGCHLGLLVNFQGSQLEWKRFAV